MKPRFVPFYALLLVPALLFVGCGDDDPTALDTVPPLAPVLNGAIEDGGLVAVWWAENTEPDLAGYFLYLEQDGTTRLVNATPLANAYATIQIVENSPIHVYVTAVDWSGNESSPSATRRAVTFDKPIDHGSDDSRGGEKDSVID
jgi:hypothetical protein